LGEKHKIAIEIFEEKKYLDIFIYGVDFFLKNVIICELFIEETHAARVMELADITDLKCVYHPFFPFF